MKLFFLSMNNHCDEDKKLHHSLKSLDDLVQMISITVKYIFFANTCVHNYSLMIFFEQLNSVLQICM